MKVIRDKEGKVINIGEWDFQKSIITEDDGSEYVVIGNPFPDGATESEEDVVTGWDGGLYVDGDPRSEGY